MPETVIGDAWPVHHRLTDTTGRQWDLGVSEQMAVEQFKRDSREDYHSLFPSQIGWESAALVLPSGV